ncbi:MAG: type II secretion system protein GspH [Alphaproteobacteria bacterium]|nr:type II secretion system protein GspH [Alphaproteobacteria bacterium]
MTSARRQGQEGGFSLVEVMIVIAIIALVSVTAVTQIAPPRSALDTEAARLVLRLETARRHALMTGAPLGFAVDGDGAGYAFLDLQADGWRVRHGDRTLGPARLTEGVDLTLTGAGLRGDPDSAGLPAPDLWFDPAGAEPPAGLSLRQGGREVSISVSSHAPVEARHAD